MKYITKFWISCYLIVAVGETIENPVTWYEHLSLFGEASCRVFGLLAAMYDLFWIRDDKK